MKSTYPFQMTINNEEWQKDIVNYQKFNISLYDNFNQFIEQLVSLDDFEVNTSHELLSYFFVQSMGSKCSSQILSMGIWIIYPLTAPGCYFDFRVGTITLLVARLV